MSDLQENAAKKEVKRSNFLTFCSVLFTISFFIFVIYGFSKMTDFSRYVGGDAYNFIINAGKATAGFVVAFGSLISAILIELLNCYKASTNMH